MKEDEAVKSGPFMGFKPQSEMFGEGPDWYGAYADVLEVVGHVEMDEQDVKVTFDYNPALVKAVKSFSHRWHPEKKAWIVMWNQYALNHLARLCRERGFLVHAAVIEKSVKAYPY